MVVRAVLVWAIAGLGLGLAATDARAQTEVVAPPAPDADALAAAMRTLAVRPDDLDTLLRAGELTLRLGDPTAAAAFFDRAARADPTSGRARAGTASVLVQLERPGEALLRFGEAEALSYEARHFAADRALAYDLVGDQRRAQRDYRLALTTRPEDQETRRRYALSLGISGDRARALEVIDALLRKGDRGAWRVRTFVLALTGDPAGAAAVANQILPPTMAQGLRIFFDRLPGLSPVDQAWAVHFGELAATEARLADARLAPSLPPLPPEPRPAVAAVDQPAPAAPDAHDRRKGKSQRAAPVAVARAEPPPVPQPNPPPPAPLREATVAAPGAPPLAARAAEPPKPAVVAPSAPPPVVTVAKLPAAPPPVSNSGESPKPLAIEAPKPAATTAPAVAAPPPVAKPIGREESILARIMATVDVPARELQRAPTGEAAAPTPVDSAAEARKRAADAKKVEDRRKAEAKKAAEAKAEADKAREAEAEAKRQRAAEKSAPARIWVQVAGGASESDLSKAWAAVRAKAPAAFRGKAGYSTPLRFTNRVLTGPFGSRAEAQAFINDIAKAGISGFVFTSAAGQKIDKLAP